MHILIAPNAFKHSITATAAAAAIEEGLRQSRLEVTCTCFPVGDGGDGTASLLVEHRHGQRITALVHDPLGRIIESSFGLIDEGKTAVIEMADSSGLRLLDATALNPLQASSYGTGELILEALNKKVKKIILCIGGSATVDGATGALSALGIRFLDAGGNVLKDLPATLSSLHHIDRSQLDPRLKEVEIIILCDVENTLLGQQGAAAVFGPQKGATPSMVKQLEAGLAQLRAVALQETGIDMATIRHGGAAGGMAAGCAAFLGAAIVNGTDHFLDLTGFDKALQQAKLVITGEGSLDTQTLQGKAPFGVAKRAKQRGLPVIGLAGRVPLLPDAALQEYFDVLLAIGHEPVPLPEALPLAVGNLTRTAKAIGNLLALDQFFIGLTEKTK